MKKFWILLALMLPLAGCPQKKKQDNGKQPEPKKTDTTPASDRSTPASPSR
jgi:hypothetical protein